jgi:hypothetical protein
MYSSKLCILDSCIPEFSQEDLSSRDGHAAAVCNLPFPVLQYTKKKKKIKKISYRNKM